MSHYGNVLSEFQSKKDSIFEPCTILSYNSSTMLVSVFGTTSKQYRDDVPVLFPALYLNAGIISPPVKDSTALLFLGSDNEPFVLPAQYLPPSMHPGSDGYLRPTSSPNRVDPSMGLNHVQSGETMIRSLGGSYIHVKNVDEVEIGTSKLHRISLSGVDGSFDTMAERIRTDVGGYRYYNGPVSSGSQDHRVLVQIGDTLPNWLGATADKDLLAAIMAGSPIPVDPTKFVPIFESQIGNVYDGTTKQRSGVDSVDLFFRSILSAKNSAGQVGTPVLNFGVSKAGGLSLQLEDSRYVTNMTLAPGRLNFVFTDKAASDPSLRTRTNSFGF